MVEFEQIVENTNRIVWRFVKKKPDIFKMMDVRYNVMSSLIRGGCNYLIKFILFGEMSTEEKAEKKSKKVKDDHHKNRTYKYKQVLHIPKSRNWISGRLPPPKKKTESKKKCSGFSYRIFSIIFEMVSWLYMLITHKRKRKEKKTEKKAMMNRPSTDLEWAIEYCKGN